MPVLTRREVIHRRPGINDVRVFGVIARLSPFDTVRDDCVE